MSEMSATEENIEMTLPCVLVTSCDSEFKEEELIKQILGSETLPQPSVQDETVSWYPWTINNKYYTADVRLCAVPSIYDMSSEIAQSMQAFIAYFDSKTKDGLEKLKPWISVVEDLAPEVLILVCDRVCENGVTRHQAQQWCLAHAFELVELNPQELPDEDDDFPESTGVKRVVQALNANVWSSVEMKDGHNQGFGLMSSLVASRHNNPRYCQDPASSSIPAESTVINEEVNQRENSSSTESQEDSVVDAMTDLDIQELAHLTAGDADVDNFERLFTKLKEMKDKACSLPHEQRKVHAEKVAKAFWTAIGGDGDEIDGLSSGEESQS
ncbi:alpha- and gamma-adaptin-binding protein p34 [Nothobranchius furzeri]|uniref:Alpha- and gamma-adaptin binding protein n=1 Tax=Nothobranchius furzeri TaxID=105023 RepID=A0A1A8V6S5_NOTFU|nr:alpha- and gamma-adaptin-binding protein p34 [Nothobranchius furzeri]KAF7224358.1 alpha- and gamma-adaptin binding protein [Nothobranchius furzeri]